MKKIILIGLMLSIIILSGCTDREIDPCEFNSMIGIDKCCVKCNEYNYTYLQHTINAPGWGREAVNECYCHNGEETIKLWG